VKKKNKSIKRVKFMKKIMETLKHPDVFGVIKYKNVSESVIKTYIHPHLIRELTIYYKELYGYKEKYANSKAHNSLLWEGDTRKTINNVEVFGVMHRPDMVIKDDVSSTNIAIEIKKGDKGQAIREGIGQSIVYSEVFDFVSYLFVDTSEDKRILNSMELSRESKLIYSLWNNYNIWLGVI